VRRWVSLAPESRDDSRNDDHSAEVTRS
jgi:hypothetical protein